MQMTKLRGFFLSLAVLLISLTAMAYQGDVIKANLVMREIIQGMPKGDRQEVRVLTANFRAGDRTLFHTHRFPVTVYVVEGAFTMAMEGRDPVTVKAGQSMIMPPQVKMTGYNHSNTDPLRLVAFYVSDPDTPFLDPIH